MSIHTLKAGLFLFLGVLVGCSSDGLGNTSADELELVPPGASECATDRCGEYPGDDCSDWNMSDGYSDECMLDCPRGGPTGPIAARFECYEVHIVSCKELSNVVVEFKGGEHYKYDGLEGHYGTFGAGDKEIVGVWVKAGNNASGDGPGYGMRFDSDADCGDGGTGGAGGDDGVGGAGGDDGMGGAGGAGGMGGSAGAGGMSGTGGDDCHCYCDDGDSDDYGDSERDGYCDDGDSDGDRGCDCDSARDCKVDIECPHGGKYGYIEVEFECHEAHIASCKELSNVVIEFEDGEHRKYDDLDGHCATLGVGERQIAGVWVKAGNNKSGDGPGYGERFDSDAECDGAGGTGGAGGEGGEGGEGGMAGGGGMGGAPGCTMDDECDPGEICVEPRCVSDPDIFCNEGLCLTDSALRAQCVETFLLCLAENPREEECVVAALLICNVECTTDMDCDAGETCVDSMCIAPAISFAADIQPYFEAGMANCVQCHSEAFARNGVKLDSYANMEASPGPLWVPGNSSMGILIPQLEANHHNGPDDQFFVDTFLSPWIDQGALDN